MTPRLETASRLRRLAASAALAGASVAADLASKQWAWETLLTIALWRLRPAGVP